MATLPTEQPKQFAGTADRGEDWERYGEWKQYVPDDDRPRAPVTRLRKLQLVIKKGEKIVRWKSFPDPRVEYCRAFNEENRGTMTHACIYHPLEDVALYEVVESFRDTLLRTLDKDEAKRYFATRKKLFPGARLHLMVRSIPKIDYQELNEAEAEAQPAAIEE
jgi:hypothetical protein